MKKYLKELLEIYQINVGGREVYTNFLTKKSFLHIRDFLYKNGNILVEDKDAGIYIATMSSGVKNMNYATVVIKLEEETVYIYAVAKEGLFNQHTSNKAIEKLKSEFLYEE